MSEWVCRVKWRGCCIVCCLLVLLLFPGVLFIIWCHLVFSVVLILSTFYVTLCLWTFYIALFLSPFCYTVFQHSMLNLFFHYCLLHCFRQVWTTGNIVAIVQEVLGYSNYTQILFCRNSMQSYMTALNSSKRPQPDKKQTLQLKVEQTHTIMNLFPLQLYIADCFCSHIQFKLLTLCSLFTLILLICGPTLF